MGWSSSYLIPPFALHKGGGGEGEGENPSRIKIVLVEWTHCFGCDEGDVTILIIYPQLCRDFLIFQFPIFTPAMGVGMSLRFLFTLWQSKLGLRIFLSWTYPFAWQILIIFSFFRSWGGGGLETTFQNKKVQMSLALAWMKKKKKRNPLK